MQNQNQYTISYKLSDDVPYLSGSQCPLNGAAEEDLPTAAGSHATTHDLQLQLFVSQQQIPAQDWQAAVLQLVNGRVHLKSRGGHISSEYKWTAN